VKERLITTTIFFSGTAIVVAAFFPNRRYEALMIWIVAMLAYGLLEINSSSRVLIREATAFERVLAVEEKEAHVPEDLRRLERGLGWISYEPGYFDFRVRPLLRELIVHRARRRLNIDLSQDPAAGIGQVDPELLNLVSTKKAEQLYGTRNIETRDLDRMITRIEAL
jgi:hypothetical protein